MKLLKANISFGLTDEEPFLISSRREEHVGLASACLCPCVLGVFACEGSRCQTGGALKVPVWKQPYEGHASFSHCHAKTQGRSDTEDTVLELCGDLESMQFI